jgi:hypothetical protein
MKLNTVLAAGLCLLVSAAFSYAQAQPGQTGTATITVQPGTPGTTPGTFGNQVIVVPRPVLVEVPRLVPVEVPVAVPVFPTPPSYSTTTAGINPPWAGSGLVPVPGGVLPGTAVPGTVTPGTLPNYNRPPGQ